MATSLKQCSFERLENEKGETTKEKIRSAQYKYLKEILKDMNSIDRLDEKINCQIDTFQVHMVHT